MAPLKKLTEPEKVPKSMQKTFEVLSELTDKFCKAHVNEEYRLLLRKLIAALCRKRPSPLQRGNSNTWAAGMIHALGMANFLFDESLEPYISSRFIHEYFDIGQSTMSSKSKQIRDLMNISHWNTDWLLAEYIEKSPLVWMVSLNGFIVDARKLPREIQQEAVDQGLIPYLPDSEDSIVSF